MIVHTNRFALLVNDDEEDDNVRGFTASGDTASEHVVSVRDPGFTARKHEDIVRDPMRSAPQPSFRIRNVLFMRRRKVIKRNIRVLRSILLERKLARKRKKFAGACI